MRNNGGRTMKRVLLLALLLAIPLAAQTPATQSISVFVTSYTIDAAAMAGFVGCQVGDAGCGTGLYICDERKQCRFYGAGAHAFTFQFVRNGGSEPGATATVATAAIQVVVQ